MSETQTDALSREAVERIGLALYGQRWKSQLAQRLRCSTRALHRKLLDPGSPDKLRITEDDARNLARTLEHRQGHVRAALSLIPDTFRTPA